MKRFLLLSIVLVYVGCSSGALDSPEEDVNPLLFNSWSKGQTILTCDSRNFPTTINHPRGFSLLELSSDFNYDSYLGGDLNKSGTFLVSGAEIDFSPPLLVNTKILNTTFEIHETLLVITHEIELDTGEECVSEDRFSVSND